MRDTSLDDAYRGAFVLAVIAGTGCGLVAAQWMRIAPAVGVGIVLGTAIWVFLGVMAGKE